MGEKRGTFFISALMLNVIEGILHGRDKVTFGGKIEGDVPSILCDEKASVLEIAIVPPDKENVRL